MNAKILIVEDQFIEANNLKNILERAGYTVCGIARSAEIALSMVESEYPDFVLLDIYLQGEQTGIDLAHWLADKNIPFIYLSANSEKDVLEAAKRTKPYGFLVKPFRKKDLLIALNVANYLHEQNNDSYKKQEEGLGAALERMLHTTVREQEKLLALTKALQPYLPFDVIVFLKIPASQSTLASTCFVRAGFDEYQQFDRNELVKALKLSEDLFTQLLTQASNHSVPRKQVESSLLTHRISQTFRIQSSLEFALPISEGNTVLVLLLARASQAFHHHHVDLFNRWSSKLSASLSSDSATGNASAIEKQNFVPAFPGIVTKSHPMLSVLDLVTLIAPRNTSVLLLGESGTGKGLMAKSIHERSARKSNVMVTVNCATLPAALIESELFGHEKGSFTGAIERRIGKFEQANGGTIFLDEIGEMPVELQSKLLRVLQEREIERVGGKNPIPIDVRVIAATNKDLEWEAANGRFRLDLYYRLNVFPILLPPLRNRREDIPELVYYFLKTFTAEQGKKAIRIEDGAMAQLLNYQWPGNIRELEHVIERTLLVTRENVIREITLQSTESAEPVINARIKPKSIEEVEREHILQVLAQSKGKVQGPGGAAELLNLAPSTLHSKMKKLGIHKNYDTNDRK